MDTRQQTPVEELTNRLAVRVFRGFHWRACDAFRFTGAASAFSRVLLVERTAGADGGDIRSGDIRLRLRPGHAYLIPAGVRFELAYARGLEMYSTYLRIDDPFGEDLLGRLGDIRMRALDPGVADEIARLAEARTGIGEALRFRALLIAAFAPLVDLDLAELGRRHRLARDYARLLAELERLPPARAAITAIARRLGEHPDALAKRFRRDTGIALKTFLQDRLRVRLAHALSASDDSVGAIAERLGFSDQFYCSRCCRRLLGLSPRAFRAQLAGHQP
jgi:AraC-like DNA-binding protein